MLVMGVGDVSPLTDRLFADTIACTQLQVSSNLIWEHFLDNVKRFGWSIVRLKVCLSHLALSHRANSSRSGPIQ